MHIYISHHARASPFSSLRRSARHNFREKSTCVSQERNTSAFWYARLDSNQRPLESELSGRQAGKPCGARVWLVLHKFPPLWRKTSEALSGRASEVFHGSSQIVVCAGHTSRSSIQLSDPIDKLLHVFNVGVWGILRVNFRRIQNNDLNPIRSECFQGSRQASHLIRSLTEVGNTPLLIKYLCDDRYLSITHQKLFSASKKAICIKFCYLIRIFSQIPHANQL